MYKPLMVVIAASTALFHASVAQSADVLSQDLDAHELTITEGDGSHTVNIEALGEIRDVCNGCTITLENGESLNVKATDIVAIIEGTLVPDE